MSDIEERDTEIARLEGEAAKLLAEVETAKRQVEERALAVARAETASDQQDRLMQQLTARLEPYLSAKEADPDSLQAKKARKGS